jgi:hypothetical protein
MGRQRGVGNKLLEISWVSLRNCPFKLSTWRSRHVPLAGRWRGNWRRVVRHGIAFCVHCSISLYRHRPSGENGCCRSRRFLNRANMVHLVSCQRCPSSEGLLAVGKRTLVGAFARVCPPMPSQRAAITKGFATSFAHVRFLASMNAIMDGEGTTLDELLPTARIVASVRANTRMYAFCTRLNLMHDL